MDSMMEKDVRREKQSPLNTRAIEEIKYVSIWRIILISNKGGNF